MHDLATATEQLDNTDAEFQRLLRAMRPRLHRYCARMTGSIIDGEDVVQEAMAKAAAAHGHGGPIDSPESWLFRIAHNAALDFLRRRTRRVDAGSDTDVDTLADPVSDGEARQVAAASLRTFMRLKVTQRSTVILMDVLGYSLEEICGLMEASLPAVKAALHRGRARLRAYASEPDDIVLPRLADPERALLAAYVDRFNARDFDAIRDMLADEVRLDLVGVKRLDGRAEVSRYFGNYDGVADWHFVAGTAEGRPAAIKPADASGPAYFVLLEWVGDRILAIRDFRYAREIAADAETVVLT